jgi:hypothetical protein
MTDRLQAVNKAAPSTDNSQPLLDKPKPPFLSRRSNCSESSQDNNNVIDLMRVVSRANRARLSKVNFAQHAPRREEQPRLRRSEYPMARRSSDEWYD